MLRFYAGKTVLVTGASSGIGAALARALAPAGVTLLLTARSEGPLHALAAEVEAAGSRAHVVPCDLAAPGGADALLAALRAGGHRVDVLVANAGFGHAGPFEAASAEVYGEMVRLNVEALTVLTRALVGGMGPGGGVLHVASTAAFQPLPYLAVYAATKAYVLALSEALHAELRPRGVHVTCLCPGPTTTGFFARAGAAAQLLARRAGPVEPVAHAGLRGLAKGKRRVVVGAANAVGAALAPRLPRVLVLGAVRWAFGRGGAAS